MNYIEQFMKDNDIKIDEEFYVIDDKGEKIKHSYYDERFMKFRFTESFKFISELSNLDCSYYFSCLMSGKCRIEKIPHKPKSVWDLTEEDKYYYINCYGEIDSTFYDCEEDVDIIKCGNAFLTEKEAHFEVERRKCEAILLKYGTRYIRSLDDDTNKYYIIFDNSVDKIIFPCCNYMQNQGTIYFESKELAQKAIKEVGEDRLKKYVFNVKE